MMVVNKKGEDNKYWEEEIRSKYCEWKVSAWHITFIYRAQN